MRLPEIVLPQNTGRNQGGYLGETIDIDSLLSAIVDQALSQGWVKTDYYNGPNRQLFFLKRTLGDPKKRVYISAGIHGDEPAGPRAVLDLLDSAEWPVDVEVYLFPCLNPTGFRKNTRENAEGIDLNRDYLCIRAPETRAHIELMQRVPSFDLMLCLHEDWEAKGFYLYELNPANRLSPAANLVDAVAKHCPIDSSDTIDGRAAVGGIIRPDLDPNQRPEWPESFYMILNKTRWSYTLETPSDFELSVRAKALTVAVQHLLGEV